MLVEINLAGNPIDNNLQLATLIVNKPEILMLNLKQTPVALKTRSAVELFNDNNAAALLLSEYRNDVLYRNKRVYSKLNATKLQLTKRSISNFSSESPPMFSQQHKRRMISSP